MKGSRGRVAFVAALALVLATSAAAVPPRLDSLRSTIGFPLEGMHVSAGAPIVVKGSATALGVVARVEVSTDGGTTWSPATGRDAWTRVWTPATPGIARIRSRVTSEDGIVEAPGAGVAVTVTAADPPRCPCTIWPPGTVPKITDDGASTPVEVGVRFRSDIDGFVSGVRFYKTQPFDGPQVANLWSTDGTLLATANFAGEPTTGWHDVVFAAPVPVAAGTPYVASVFMPMSHYALDPRYFFPAGFDRPPLHAPGNQVGAGNGVYSYGTVSSFPDSTFNESNYWIDVRFVTANDNDMTRPHVTDVEPANGATGVAAPFAARVWFSEPLDPSSVRDSTAWLRGPSGGPVPATLEYAPLDHRLTIIPRLPHFGTAYTVRLTTGLRDLAGNALPADLEWTFTTATAPVPPADEGPGGPVLVITSSANPFTRYYGEILRAEGLNLFTMRDLAQLDPVGLSAFDVAILGEMPVDPVAARMLADWVQAGGNLIAMRPDPRLAGLVGLTGPAGTLADRYLKVETGTAAGKGIVGSTIQFHGAADLYGLDPASGAQAIAWLYSGSNAPTARPAVTLRSVGANGGEVVAFTYDLARSVVYTRQGNPAWVGQDRDGISPWRAEDLFWGPADFDPQPDWVDLAKIAIPQADEQQRLLANLVLTMELDHAPLPRFWYFPRGAKAVIVMTGDNHGSFGMAPRFDTLMAQSDSGCSAEDWECVRATGYLYSGPPFTDAQAQFYTQHGFDVAVHLTTACVNVPASTMATEFDQQLAKFATTYPGVPPPSSNRTHCIAWLGYADPAEMEAARGIRLDTNYYYFPPAFVRNTPGLFTGSGIPMRLARADGSVIDCYQATTQFTDDGGQSIPLNLDVVLDHALGAEGWYGAFTCNVHFDMNPNHVSDAIIASARTRGVPVVSARQMLTWLDGRNRSSFKNLAFAGRVLGFDVEQAAGARNLQALLPFVVAGDTLATVERDAAPVAFTVETVKGRACARFDASSGRYQATYHDHLVSADTPISGLEFGRVTPNPALSEVQLSFALPGPGPVSLDVYGVRGNFVRNLWRGPSRGGVETVTWDRRDHAGRRAPAGVYLARLHAGRRTATRRIVLLP